MGNGQECDFKVLLGLLILVAFLIGVAYLLAVASEWVVSHFALSVSDNLRLYVERHSAGYHVAIGAIAVGVLYAGLQAFRKFFEWVGKPGLEVLFVVIRGCPHWPLRPRIPGHLSRGA